MSRRSSSSPGSNSRPPFQTDPAQRAMPKLSAARLTAPVARLSARLHGEVCSIPVDHKLPRRAPSYHDGLRTPPAELFTGSGLGWVDRVRVRPGSPPPRFEQLRAEYSSHWATSAPNNGQSCPAMPAWNTDPTWVEGWSVSALASFKAGSARTLVCVCKRCDERKCAAIERFRSGGIHDVHKGPLTHFRSAT